MRRYARLRSNIAIAALAGSREFRAWAHYPRQDVVDAARRTEFYYHAHAGVQSAEGEHGHFHVFVRSGRHAGFHHAVAISLDHFGQPKALFLTNQWVTGERWVSSDVVAPMVRRFECVANGRLAPVSQWVTSMLQLYRPEILALHAKRDAWLERQRAAGCSVSRILSDVRHDVIVKKPICLASRLAVDL